MFQLGPFACPLDAVNAAGVPRPPLRALLRTERVTRVTIDEARMATDPRRRQKMYSQFQALVKDEAAYLFLFRYETSLPFPMMSADLIPPPTLEKLLD
jgi:hypothetical protein